MATVKRFEDLVIWQKARKLSIEVYGLTTKGAFAKDYSLKDQINRATGSVMDNIAEGFGRMGKQEFIQFFATSKSSPNEVQSQLYRTVDRKHISTEEFITQYNEADTIANMTAALMKYLQRTEIKGLKYKPNNSHGSSERG